MKKYIFITTFFLFFSCHRTNNNSQKDVLKIDELKTVNSSPIVTNSLDSNFVYDLIETQKVQKGDTVLFRKWGTTDKKPILIHNDKTKYEVFGDSIVEFYKTGEEKFSTYKITTLNKSNNNTFHIYSIVISNDFREPYSGDQSSSFPSTTRKISKFVGQFEFDCLDMNGLLVDFRIRNNALNIIKLSSYKYLKEGVVKHKLDTLIVLKDKNYIYPDSLLFVLNKKKNRLKD